MKWNPSQAACSNCSSTKRPGGHPARAAQARAKASPPTIQNMSKPRSASIETSRPGVFGVAAVGIASASPHRGLRFIRG